MRFFCLLPFALTIAAAPPPATDSGPAPTYVDLVDLALAAPIVAQVRVTSAVPVPDERAPGLRAGEARLFVEGEVTALYRAPGPLAARVRYLVDLPRDARGRPPRPPKGSTLLILASPVAERPDELRLVAPDAQLPASPAAEARLRAIIREAAAPAPAPAITGVGRAFFSPGNLPGESETQIFLQTADRRPVSISVLRRPGQTPRWAVALSEMVDESAVAPKPETLLWYRLACGLPKSVPARSVENAEAGAAAAIARDYRLVLDSLGPCARTRAAR
jgi:hypothetical protein